MTKYTKRKHGLTIGSDNTFFVVDRAEKGSPPLNLPTGVEEVRDGYRALLTFKGYDFNQYNGLNISIKTPAIQLVWVFTTIHWEETFDYAGNTRALPMQKTYPEVSSWWVGWLEANVGKRYTDWDTYTQGQRTSPCLFFKKRSDALKMAKAIDNILDGISL